MLTVPVPHSWRSLHSLRQESFRNTRIGAGQSPTSMIATLEFVATQATIFPSILGGNTVDHFRPKSLFPQLAYKWTNLRLSCQLMNARKGDSQRIIDPFELRNNAFCLIFPAMLIAVNLLETDDQYDLCQDTIERLGLNDERVLKARLQWVIHFARQEIDGRFLRRHAPFIWSEIQRQQIEQHLGEMMLP